MRFVIFAGLLSLVAAAPAQQEKRQTDDTPASLAFTGGAYPAYTPGAFPPEGTGTLSTAVGSADQATGSFTGSFVRPTGRFISYLAHKSREMMLTYLKDRSAVVLTERAHSRALSSGRLELLQEHA